MKDKARKILAVVFTLIALGCAVYLGWYYISSFKADKSYEEAKENVVKEVEKEPDDDTSVEIPVDFASLKEVNPDVYAWITIPGTHIDYPIVQSQDDNEYYLNHTWDKQYAEQGAIFTQVYNHKDFEDYNTVIYGHRMGSGSTSMFHDLHGYLDKEYFKEHSQIVVYTETKKLIYQVFAAVIYDDRLIMNAFNFIIRDERQAFLDSVMDSAELRNQYAEDVQVSPDDHLITLSTCIESEPNHRLLVEAVLVSEE